MNRLFPLVFISIGGLCLAPVGMRAQGDATIRGTVLAGADRSSLPGAIILLQGAALPKSLEATADTGGRFGFTRLTPDDYLLTVTHDGFQERQYRLSLRPREIRTVTLRMTLQPVLELVEVTAAADALPSTHSPSSTMISGGRLDDLSLAQRNNLADAILTSAPGMIRGHDDFVHVRGHEIALNPFINGISFWENPHLVFSPGLGADYIQSVNVMTGGFSAEYGNRFGGVLDVVTKSGFAMEDNGSITFGAGTALRNNVSLEFGGHTERAGYYVNVAGFESARFLSPPEENSMHNTGRGARSFAQLDFALDSKNSLRLVLMGDGANFQLPQTLLDAQFRPGFRNSQRTRSQTAIFSWDHVYSPNTLLHAAFYQRWSGARMLPNTDRYGATLDAARDLGTYGLKGDWTRFLARHALKAGLDLVLLRPEERFHFLSQPWIDFTHLPGINQPHLHFRGPNLGPGIPRPVVFHERRTGGQISLYVQDKVQLTRGLTADIGLRFDRYALAISDSHFSPRVNVAYEFRSGTVLHASYNHFFVPPPVEAVLASSAGLTRFVSEIGKPLPPLRPIVENQFELGMSRPVAKRVRVGLTGYYRISDDPPHTILFPDARYYAYANFDEGRAYGLEVKTEIPALPAMGLSGYLNYALGRVWFSNPVTAGFVTEAAHIDETSRFLAPMDQTHTLTSGVTYRNRRTRLWTSMGFEFGSGSPGGHAPGDHAEHGEEAGHSHAPVAGGCAVRCPEHFTQNLSIGWDVLRTRERPRLSLQFNIENLTDNVYLISKESTFVQGQYYIPRLFSGSLKFRF